MISSTLRRNRRVDGQKKQETETKIKRERARVKIRRKIERDEGSQ